jgi:hypothetical protein
VDGGTRTQCSPASHRCWTSRKRVRARELLTVLQERFTDPPAAVAQEIDIALQTIERSSG